MKLMSFSPLSEKPPVKKILKNGPAVCSISQIRQDMRDR